MAVCSALSNMSTFADLLVYPTSCVYFFWFWVLEAFFLILTMILYSREKENAIQSDFLSCMGVSSIATIFLGMIGTLIEGSTGIPVVQQDIMLYILALNLVFIAIWFFKKD